jgi:biopolymer transport protein TolQ
MPVAQIDLIHMIGNASFIVQLVLLLLLFFSVTSWAIILIKYRYIKKAFQQSAEFTDFFWKSRDLSNAFSKAKQLHGSPVARIFRIGYVELKKTSQSGGDSSQPQSSEETGEDLSFGTTFSGMGNVNRALRRAINTEMTRMMQMVPFLATTGNTTPFIGLFGTVWGIMNSFSGIGQSGSASLAVVAPGISEALVATAAGTGSRHTGCHRVQFFYE